MHSEKCVWLQDVYTQVLVTRLTPVDNMRLFLKLINFDKNRLVAFHSFSTQKVSFMRTKELREKCTRVCMTVIHFVVTN
jgi:hypothetical protein